MLIIEERALVTDLQDKIIALLVEQQEASSRGDEILADKLQCEIERLQTECADIRRVADEHSHRRRA
jgi:hypothetical protein